MATAYDRVGLLLAMKEKGKEVDFDHIYEKVHRDVSFAEKREASREEIEAALRKLTSEGYTVKRGGLRGHCGNRGACRESHSG